MYDTNKVSEILEKCANNHAEFKLEVLMCQTLHNKFNTEVTYLKTVLIEHYPLPPGPARLVALLV